MTSQKTIERCRLRVKELEDINSSLVVANKTLLNNNVILAEENVKLRKELSVKNETVHTVEQQRQACVRKCELALAEKNAALYEAQRKAANTKTLADVKWSLDNQTGKIILTGVLP
jgi:hypothetical protein